MSLTQIHNSNLASGGTTPTGSILSFASDNAPDGWMVCDGRSLSRELYSDLFSVIGTAWGSPDGTTFNIPDLRGRFLRGHDDGAGRDPDAAGRSAMNAGGASGDNVGSVQGDATSKNGLSASSTGTVQSGGSHSHTITGYNDNRVSGNANLNSYTIGTSTTARTHGTSTHTGHSHGLSLSTTIGSGDNETRPINASVTYIIKY